MRGELGAKCVAQRGRNSMVQTRIKPYSQQAAEQARREQQTHAYRCNQVFGLVLVAAAILLWGLFHTNSQWIFPQGWWRP